MRKTNCCPDSYLGIREDHFKAALAERFLTNGQRIPCLSCRSLYEIQNYSLVLISHISVEEANLLLRTTTEELLKRLMPLKEETDVIDREIEDEKFMKNLNIKW